MKPPPSLLPGLLDAGIAAGLGVTLAAMIYGHAGAEAYGLSLTESYITEYMKRAPHWPWLILSSFAFAVLLFLLAIAILRQAGSQLLAVIGALLLAATAMGNFFVAYAPVRRVEQPPPSAHEWWAPAWWFTSRTSRNAYEDGLANAYSDVHYRAIRLVVACGVSGILCVGAAAARTAGGRGFSIFSLASVPLMAALFIMTDHVMCHRGLSQRLGFALLYAWLWAAWRHYRAVRKFGPHHATFRGDSVRGPLYSSP